MQDSEDIPKRKKDLDGLNHSLQQELLLAALMQEHFG